MKTVSSKVIRYEFPSPCGDPLFLIAISINSWKTVFMFPSPLGDLLFLIDNVDRYIYKAPFPSPLGDLLFLIIPSKSIYRTGYITVSVPSRGSFISNDFCAKVEAMFHETFPSPLGDLLFLINELSNKEFQVTSFRPLSGIFYF